MEINPVINVEGSNDPVADVEGSKEAVADVKGANKPVAEGADDPVVDKRDQSNTDVDGTAEPAADAAPTPATSVTKDQVKIKFPDGVAPDQRMEFARAELARLSLDASDAAVSRAIQKARGGSEIQIQQTLHIGTEAETLAAAREILFDPAAVKARENNKAKDYEGKCLVEAANLRGQLAARGIFVPVMSAKDAPGRFGHRFLVVGNQIVDPTFAQFLAKDSTREGGHEPFVGTYQDMVNRLAAEGIPDPKGLLAKEWGLLEPDKEGTLQFDGGVGPTARDEVINPSSEAEVKRLMEEQAKAGIEPGRGLPPHLVRRVRGESDPEPAVPDCARHLARARARSTTSRGSRPRTTGASTVPPTCTARSSALARTLAAWSESVFAAGLTYRAWREGGDPRGLGGRRAAGIADWRYPAFDDAGYRAGEPIGRLTGSAREAVTSLPRSTDHRARRARSRRCPLVDQLTLALVHEGSRPAREPHREHGRGARAELVARAIRGALRAYFARLILDERLFAVGYCAEGAVRPEGTSTLPATVQCDSLPPVRRPHPATSSAMRTVRCSSRTGRFATCAAPAPASCSCTT